MPRSLDDDHLVTASVPRGDGRSRYVRGMNEHYLIVVEQLVREGRSEREIERTVDRLVEEDARLLEDELDDLPAAA